MIQFWKDANKRTRLAVVVGILALLVHVGSWVNHSADGIGAVGMFLHLSIMVLGVLAWASLGYHHLLAWRTNVRSWEGPDLPPLPRGTFPLLAMMTLYLFGIFIVATESPYSGTIEVRLFSAAWMWFALVFALVFDRVSRRIAWYKQYQSARRG